jgi:peptidoglycan endopeptidase LytE
MVEGNRARFLGSIAPARAIVSGNAARLVAPVALIAAIIATVLVVEGALGSHKARLTTASTASATTVHSRRRGGSRRFYTVRPGDSLSSIAAKTGVPVASLEALNPSVNPSALQVGQRLRLRR